MVATPSGGSSFKLCAVNAKENVNFVEISVRKKERFFSNLSKEIFARVVAGGSYRAVDKHSQARA